MTSSRPAAGINVVTVKKSHSCCRVSVAKTRLRFASGIVLQYWVSNMLQRYMYVTITKSRVAAGVLVMLQ